MPQKVLAGGSLGTRALASYYPALPPGGDAAGGSQGPESEGTGKGSVLGLDPAVCSGPQGGWASHWILGIMLEHWPGTPGTRSFLSTVPSQLSVPGRVLCCSRASVAGP